jgi:hypothetical protein
LLILGVIQISLLHRDYNLHPLLISYPLRIAALNYFVFICGIAAARHQAEIIKYANRFKLIIMASIIFLGLYIFYQGRSLYLETGNYLFFYSQWRPNVLLYSLGIFCLLFLLSNRLKFPALLTKTLPRLSFLVFFVHVIILEAVWKVIGSQFSQFWFDIVFFLITTFLSFLLAYLIHRIPYLSKITG